MSKKIAHLVWAWGSTFAFALLLYYLATIEDFQVTTDATNEVIKVVFRMLLYSVFFTLLYRSIIATLKNTVKRLAGWRSRREAIEDAEFVLIIETMAVVVTILITVLFAIFDEVVQFHVSGRNILPGDAQRDVLVSTMAALLTALIVYSMPVIGELEVALLHKIRTEANIYLPALKGRNKKEHNPPS